MRTCHMLFRGALLGSTLAVAALTPAVAGNLSRDQERILAVYGNRTSASQSGFASHFSATRRPDSTPPGLPLIDVFTYQAPYLFSSPCGR